MARQDIRQMYVPVGLSYPELFGKISAIIMLEKCKEWYFEESSMSENLKTESS